MGSAPSAGPSFLATCGLTTTTASVQPPAAIASVRLTARAVVQSSGLSVDNSEAVGALSDTAITEADLMAGRWDAADVRLWEVDWADPANRRLIFRGHLGEVVRSGAAFRAELEAFLEAELPPALPTLA